MAGPLGRPGNREWGIGNRPRGAAHGHVVARRFDCPVGRAASKSGAARTPTALSLRSIPDSPFPIPTHTTRPAKAGLVVCKRVATPASVTPAPDSATTVAPFRAWRGLQPIVAKAPTGATIAGLPGQRPWPVAGSAAGQIVQWRKLAEREGFEPSIRGLAVYTLSRRAPSTTRTSLRSLTHERCEARQSSGSGEFAQASLRRSGRRRQGRGSRRRQCQPLAGPQHAVAARAHGLTVGGRAVVV